MTQASLNKYLWKDFEIYFHKVYFMYVIESLKKLGSFIWNSLSNQIKNETEYTLIMEFNEKVVW